MIGDLISLLLYHITIKSTNKTNIDHDLELKNLATYGPHMLEIQVLPIFGMVF